MCILFMWMFSASPLVIWIFQLTYTKKLSKLKDCRFSICLILYFSISLYFIISYFVVQKPSALWWNTTINKCYIHIHTSSVITIHHAMSEMICLKMKLSNFLIIHRNINIRATIIDKFRAVGFVTPLRHFTLWDMRKLFE